MKNVISVIGLTVLTSSALAKDCTNPNVSIQGPNNKEYRVTSKFACKEVRFTGSPKDLLSELEANILKNVAIIDGPQSSENEDQILIEFVGKSKGNDSCRIGDNGDEKSFATTIKLTKASNQIVITRSIIGSSAISNGEVKNLELKSLIAIQDNSYTRQENIEGVVQISGIASRFPDKVRAKLEEKFSDFTMCLKNTLQK